MKIRIEDINDTRKKLFVTLGAEELEKERGSVIRDIARNARIPGFRPGKAPLSVVEKRYAKEIGEELNRKLISESYRFALKESKMEPLQLLDVSGGDFKTGVENELAFELDIHPEFNLPDYLGLPLTRQSDAVADGEIEEALRQLREQRSDFATVERAAAKGDYVKLNYEGKSEGREIAEMVPAKPVFGKQSATWEEAGDESSPIPGFSLALIGMKAGDQKEIAARFPEDFVEESLRGKEAVYSTEVLEVRERVLPELDEAFAKGLGVDSVEALRERVKTDLEQRKKVENQAALRNQAAETLASRVEFALPESLVEQETEAVLRGFLMENIRRGVPQEAFEERKQQLYEGARQSALRRIKVRLLLARVAEKEKLEVVDEDFGRHIMAEARRTSKKPEKIARELRNDKQRIQNIRTEILLDKALDLLVQKATITEA